MAAVSENSAMVDVTNADVKTVIHELRKSEQSAESDMPAESDVPTESDVPAESDMLDESDMPTESEPKKKKKKKRSSGTPAGPAPKKKKLSGGDGSKTALSTLNELMPGLQYNCVGQTGPVHQPTFTVHVQVNAQVHTLTVLMSCQRRPRS